LTSGWFLQDTPGKYDSVDGTNLGLVARSTILKGGVVKDFETIIHSDFFQIYRHLPSGCAIRLKFIRNEDSFSFIENVGDYKIELVDLRVTVRKIELNKNIYDANEKQFAKGGSAILPTVRSQIKTFVIASGITSIVQPSIINGQLPRNMIVCFLSAAALNNAITKNPYNFQHFNIKSINARVNGVCKPSIPYTTDFASGIFMRAYRGLFDSIGISHSNGGNSVTPDHFVGGCTFFAFDLTPDMCNGWHEHPRKSGVIDLELSFSKALTEPINIIVYSSYDNFIMIDKFRNLTTDFAV
jgi:hypothetical protein